MNITTTTLPNNVAPAQQANQDLTDEALIQALCSSKAEWAMEKLYERYKRYAYALAYRMLNDSFMAEDVVQDVFFTLWQKAFSYQEQQGSVKTWLLTIVRNRAIDKIRSTAHRDYQCTYLQEVNGQEVVSPEPEMWEHVWEGEQSTYIRNALAQLPTGQGEVIELNYFYGYTHAEIATRQQIPLGTVKGRIRLGLQKMKLLLQKYDIDAGIMATML